MPGVTPRSDGLHVSFVGRNIVQQDGKPGQSNPAVNMYGTHLRASDDFTITAVMKSIKGTASLRLYGDVPTTQDEFRVEPKSIDIVLQNNTLTVSTWDGYNNQLLSKQLPETVQSYAVLAKDSNTVAVKRQEGNLYIAFNGVQIAALEQKGLFRNKVWFGLEAKGPGDSWVLSDLYATATGNINAVNTQLTPPYPSSSQEIQSLASRRRPGFLVGAAMALPPAVADSQYGAVALGGNFGQMTTENALKWQYIHPQPMIYDFREADALVALAIKNKLKVNGHTLVFGEANPQWVQELPTSTSQDKTRVRQVLTDHISQTVSHYKGKVASWDVVNEPLADYDEPAGTSGLRRHIWYTAMGENYIDTAFQAARRFDPNAKLYINDFGLESNGERWDMFLALVKKLKARGVPIDGVGFEAHVYQPGDEINPRVLREHIRELAKVGLTSRISEMDVHDKNGRDAQATQYGEVFEACLSEPSCVSWSTWGVTDRYNLFKSDSGRLQEGHDFLWDEWVQSTPSVTRIRQILSR